MGGGGGGGDGGDTTYMATAALCCPVCECRSTKALKASTQPGFTVRARFNAFNACTMAHISSMQAATQASSTTTQRAVMEIRLLKYMRAHTHTHEPRPQTCRVMIASFGKSLPHHGQCPSVVWCSRKGTQTPQEDSRVRPT
jgi:hypothetical protein